MAKHALPKPRATRRPFWTLLGAYAATAALVGGTLALTPTTVTGEAHAATVASGWPSSPIDSVCDTDADCAQYAYDYGLPIEGYGVDPSKVGDHSHPYGWRAASYDLAEEDTSDTACWVEKVHSAATAEVICGYRGGRPATDTADIGAVFGPGCGWVASREGDGSFDIAPAGCN